MKTQNIIIKGLIIFGILGFFLFILLILLGMAMNAFGLTCKCYTVFAWSLIGIAVLSGFLSWVGCCNRE